MRFNLPDAAGFLRSRVPGVLGGDALCVWFLERRIKYIRDRLWFEGLCWKGDGEDLW